MLVRIGNVARDYAWGSRTAIAELLGRAPSGAPEAELWLGAHPGSPASIETPEHAGGATHLAEWIERDPAAAVGDTGSLPFLLKVLAADAPLSLQAHPTLQRAREGFARENAEGIPLDAPHRNYKDPLHKPEAVVALSERFEALCGFRPILESRAIVSALSIADDDAPVSEPELLAALRDRLEGDAPIALRRTLEWLLEGDAQVQALVGHVTALASVCADQDGPYADSFTTAADLARAYPGDPGIVISLLLNRVTLAEGEALYLPAGNIHAYLSGLAIEIMAASDNVLRGGLTPKHVDIPELLDVLEFDPVPVPRLVPSSPEPGIDVFRPDVPDFVLARVEASAGVSPSFTPAGPAIALCVEGEVSVSGLHSATVLARGESVFVTPDEGTLAFAGSGRLFLGSQGGPLGDRA